MISTKTTLVYMADGFKIEEEERDWGQVVMRSLGKVLCKEEQRNGAVSVWPGMSI